MPRADLRRRFDRRAGSGLAALLGYGVLGFLFLGLRLVVDPGGRYVGFSSDPKVFIWCFGWWPHAILSGQNPFISSAVWAPSGVNLMWAASVPGLALLFAPLTLLVGPVDSYNAASVLLPVLAAWTGFMLCRQLTRAMWPSLVGGHLFGFSSYVFAQEGHPNISAVFLVPLIALVIVRYVEGQLGGCDGQDRKGNSQGGAASLGAFACSARHSLVARVVGEVPIAVEVELAMGVAACSCATCASSWPMR